MPSLKQRLAAAEKQAADARAKASELRKKLREQERRERLEAERRARIARQAQALELLDWVESHDVGPIEGTVNAFEYISGLMSQDVDQSADDDEPDTDSFTVNGFVFE